MRLFEPDEMLFGPMANKNTHADLYGMVFTLTWKLQGSLKCFQSHCFNLDLRCSFHSLFDRNMIFKELPFFNSGFIHLILFFIFFIKPNFLWESEND